MVLHNVGFEKKEMFYFDYINIFMRGKNKKIYEYINRDGTQGRIYYDDNGNIIKEEQCKDESIEATYNLSKCYLNDEDIEEIIIDNKDISGIISKTFSE